MNAVDVFKDSCGVLKLRYKDIEYSIKPIRYFPFTRPHECIGFLNVHHSGASSAEVVFLPSLEQLSDTARSLVEEELNKVNPAYRISRIIAVDITKKIRLDVITDRGRLSFEIYDQTSVFKIPPRLVIIKDTEGKKYIIDRDQLDRKSKTLLDSYLS